MSEQPNGPMRPSRFTHPAYVLVSVAIGFLLLLPWTGPWDAIACRNALLGLEVGLPMILVQKWIFRRTIPFYTEFMTTPFGRRRQGPNFLYCLPSMLGSILFNMLSILMGSRMERLYYRAPVTGCGVVFVLMVLLYPEQKAIYQAAWARIERMRAGADDRF